MAKSKKEEIAEELMAVKKSQKVLEQQHNEVTKALKNIQNLWVLIVAIQLFAWLF